MSKIFLLFLILASFNLSLNLSSSCADYVNSLFPKCDVEKDFNQVLNGKRCSNVVKVDVRKSLYLQETLLEVINDHTIKQWTFTKTFPEYTEISIPDHQICLIRESVAFGSNINTLIENFSGIYYFSWNFFNPNNFVIPLVHLTDNLGSIIFESGEYLLVIGYNGKNVTEKVFTKADKKFIDMFILEEYETEIANFSVPNPADSLWSKTLNSFTIVATLEDGSKKLFSPEHPKTVFERPLSVKKTNSSIAYFVLLLPIGIILYVIKISLHKKPYIAPRDDKEVFM